MATSKATIDLGAVTDAGTGRQLAVISGGGVTLAYGDTLVISVGPNFSAGTQVTGLGFFNAVDGAKGSTPKGYWLRSGASQVPVGVKITGNSDGSVTIEDNDASDDQDYYYTCTARDPGDGSDYLVDPELMIRKKSTTDPG